MSIANVNQRAASEYIARRESFKASALSGIRSDSLGTFGKLPREWQNRFVTDRRDLGIDYVVLSYETPIAWHTPRGWVVPDVRYSVTTSAKHMPPLWRGLRGETMADLAA